MTTVAEAQAPKKPKMLDVVFNRKHIIQLPKGELNGLQIKLDAIAQGIKIQPSYVLFVVKDGKHRKLIGDTDMVSIHEDMVFAAVADDDNS